MHPEIRQDHPGACPICGMALEPATVTAETGPSPELRDMSRRFWIGLVLALPVLVLQMGGHIVQQGSSPIPRFSKQMPRAEPTPLPEACGRP